MPESLKLTIDTPAAPEPAKEAQPEAAPQPTPKASTQEVPTAPPAKPVEPPAPPTPAPLVTAEEMMKWAAELQTGNVSKETRATLQSRGISDEMLDVYVTGIKAKADAELEGLVTDFGGREQIDRMRNWAYANMDYDRVQTFNMEMSRAMADGDLTAIRNQLDWMKNKYERDADRHAEQMVRGVDGVKVDFFATEEEMYKAIRDPRYKTDPVYRAFVMQRAAKLV